MTQMMTPAEPNTNSSVHLVHWCIPTIEPSLILSYQFLLVLFLSLFPGCLPFLIEGLPSQPLKWECSSGTYHLQSSSCGVLDKLYQAQRVNIQIQSNFLHSPSLSLSLSPSVLPSELILSALLKQCLLSSKCLISINGTLVQAISEGVIINTFLSFPFFSVPESCESYFLNNSSLSPQSHYPLLVQILVITPLGY